MKQRRWLVLVAMTLMIHPQSLFAAETAQPLSLTDAIGKALKHSPQITAARYQVVAAASQISGSRSGLLPQFYVSETYTHTNSPLWAFCTKLNQGVIQTSDFAPQQLNDPDAVDNYKTELNLSWSLYDGGRTWNGYRQAQAGAEAATFGMIRTERQVIARVAKGYMALLLAAETYKVIDQALHTARAHFKFIEDRHTSGLAVKSDVLRAQVRIADLKQQSLMAESRLKVAQAVLWATMGQDDLGPIEPQTPLENHVSTEGDLNHWIDLALSQRSDLKQLDREQIAAQRAVRRSKAGHWPRLALQGNYEINSENFCDSNDNYAVGAVQKLDLYSGQRISPRFRRQRQSWPEAKQIIKTSPCR